MTCTYCTCVACKHAIVAIDIRFRNLQKNLHCLTLDLVEKLARYFTGTERKLELVDLGIRKNIDQHQYDSDRSALRKWGILIPGC